MAWEWVGPVATCIAGIGGVAGTVWTAGRGRKSQIEAMKIQAQNERAHGLIAEKRAAYAQYLRSAEKAVDASDEIRGLAEKIKRLKDVPTGSQDKDLLSELREQLGSEDKIFKSHMANLAGLRAEITILGGLPIGRLASDTNASIYGYTAGKGEFTEVSARLSKLSMVMHLDIDIDNPERERVIAKLTKDEG
ncbi:hypothetical protein [Micromonospora sp. L31]|uniref:hypothetical protein n=1 Tax=Micromonospora sp. L31 TaxID=3452213 RepID=UPI003F8988A1